MIHHPSIHALAACTLITHPLLGVGDSTPDAMFRQLCMTLLQQSHLCPVPLESQAVYWQYDHALALYPLPHLLVLADSVPPNQTLFQDCQCLNPVRWTGPLRTAD